LKKGRISIITAVFLAIAAALVAANITLVWSLRYYDSKLSAVPEKEKLYSKLSLIADIFDSQYVGDADWDQMMEGALYGYVYGSGDRYATYINAEDYKRFVSDASGELIGIGINSVFDADRQMIRIIDVFKDSPASGVGIMTGDYICRVEGQDVAELGYYETVDRILGQEGTEVNLTVLRGEEELDFSITRAVVQIDPVSSHVIGGCVGYVKISDFNSKTFSQFQTAVDALAADSGIKGIIFDVRNNSGGSVDSIVKTLDYLMGEGTIVTMKNKAGEETVYSSDAKEIDIPMEVLVNENTVSAAELFAAALQDSGKADVVGTQTFGKGTEVVIVPLNDGTAVSFSDRYYYTPSGKNLELRGVTPDIAAELEIPENKTIYELTDDEDTQLQAALGVLAGKTGIDMSVFSGSEEAQPD